GSLRVVERRTKAVRLLLAHQLSSSVLRTARKRTRGTAPVSRNWVSIATTEKRRRVSELRAVNVTEKRRCDSPHDSVARHVVARVGETHAALRDEVVEQTVERLRDRAIAAQLERPVLLDHADAGL